MAWCFNTGPSVVTVLSMHPSVSSCSWVSVWNSISALWKINWWYTIGLLQRICNAFAYKHESFAQTKWYFCQGTDIVLIACSGVFSEREWFYISLLIHISVIFSYSRSVMRFFKEQVAYLYQFSWTATAAGHVELCVALCRPCCWHCISQQNADCRTIALVDVKRDGELWCSETGGHCWMAGECE